MFFAKPLEYRVEIPGERFVQGQAIAGTLTAVNRDSDPRGGLSLEVGLAFGVFKELKKSGAAALAILERQTLAEGVELEPGDEKTLPWRFALALDAPVKTSESGPFLLYGGRLEVGGERGQIDLPVELAPPLETFITTLENLFAFEARGRRFAEGFLEVRFKPPASYPTLEEMVVAMRLDDHDAHLRFRGRLKALRRGEGGGVGIRKTALDRTVPRAEFLLNNEQPNRAVFKNLLAEVLAEFAPVLAKPAKPPAG
jgi:hypothetical protein